MSQNDRDDIDRVRARLERFQLSNADLSQQLSDVIRRSQKLASSLGFRDIYEAQAAIDTADPGLSYRECLKELEKLGAQRDSALARVRELEEQRQSGRSTASDIRRLSNSVPDEIVVDVLPFALRLVHCEVSGLRQCDVDELPAEGTVRMYELTGQGLEALQRNARVVREWEDMFSFHHKDRKSKVSRLAQGESFRFQRALYRIMLVCWLYGMDSIPASDMQDEGYPDIFREIYQARQTKLLTKYPTDDLFEINRVVRFLSFVAATFITVKHPSVLSVSEVYDWKGLYLFAGPAFIMNEYRNREGDADDDIHFQELCSYLDDDGPYSKFLTHGLDDILRTRTGKESDPHYSQRILDSVEGADDLCICCQSQDMGGLILLTNESSWDDMKFTNILSDLYEKYSSIWPAIGIKYPEKKLFSDEIKKTPSRQLMEEIFNLRQGKYISWNREDWACRECWMNLITDTISIWWAKQCL